MKSIEQIINRYRGHSPDFGGLMHPDDVKAVAEEFAAEVLDWVLTTKYQKGDSHKFVGDDDYCWYDDNDGTYRSSTLVEQYNKLPIIVPKSEYEKGDPQGYAAMIGDNNIRRKLPNVKDPNK